MKARVHVDYVAKLAYYVADLLALRVADLMARTRLPGHRYLQPGEEALVPKSAVRHGEFSVAARGCEVA